MWRCRLGRHFKFVKCPRSRSLFGHLPCAILTNFDVQTSVLGMEVVKVVNNTITMNTVMTVAPAAKNPAPGVCLPVIVNFCQYHRVPYNFTVFPNYIGHFGQRDAQQVIFPFWFFIWYNRNYYRKINLKMVVMKYVPFVNKSTKCYS